MKHNLHTRLLSAAALALIAGPGLSSCSKPAQENAAGQNATEPVSNEQAATEPAASGSDASAQNAKGLLKAMSDYLAAQNSISLGYDSTFEVVSDDLNIHRRICRRTRIFLSYLNYRSRNSLCSFTDLG